MTQPPSPSSSVSARTSELPDRDRRIVQLVARLQQVSASHVANILFPNQSRTPVDRALKRLVDRDYLIRIERRIVGGSRGGSGQYVYALGRRGFWLHYEGKYSPARAIRYHALAIADCVVTLRQLERDGKLEIAGMSTEPDCWVRIGGDEMKPDLYVDAHLPGRSLLLWLEVDMGSEGQRQIRDKLERYWRAYNEADEVDWPIFPIVVWVAIDGEREKELKWLVSQTPVNAQPLFRVVTLSELSSLF